MMPTISIQDYFLRAMRKECYRYKGWVLEAFAFVETLNGKEKTWPLALTRHPDGSYSYYDDELKTDVTLNGTFRTGGPFHLLDGLTVTPEDLASVQATVVTTYGNVLINCTCLIHAFGGKVPYQTGRLTVGQLEKLIEHRLADTPAEGAARDDKFIYIDEFKRFNEGVRFLEGLSQLCVPSATPKTMTVSPEVIKRRDELLEQHKDHLQDPVVLARIDRELVAMERAWLKGDPGERFYIKDKSFDVVRKRTFLMQGQENGFGKIGKTITSSLAEGWEVKNLPAMANALRNGSYSRGALTALGGVEAKGNYRIFQNTVVAEDDCGSRLGLRLHLWPDWAKHFISFTVIEPDDSLTELTTENIKDYIGKDIAVRSVGYCKTAAPNICGVCVGKKIAQTPNAISTYASDLGSIFVGMLLAAMHGVALKTTQIDYKSMLR